MDAYNVAIHLFFFAKKLIQKDVLSNSSAKKLIKVFEILAPALIVICVYQYLKCNMLRSAYEYERYVKKKRGFLKKVSKKLNQLSRLNGQVYFCYMPISHGTRLPPTYTLFMAIKEVLTNSNAPASRGLRTNLLSDLIHSDAVGQAGGINRMDLPETDFLEVAPNDTDPLSELNLDIMNCSREMIIHGIKDFDVMYTLYHVMETLSDDSDE